MSRSGFDSEALIRQFSQATAQQGEAVRKSVQDATLKALQARELTLKSIEDTVKGVTQAVSAGAAQNPLGARVEQLLAEAVTGMDAAVLQAVEANRRALEQLVAQGADLQQQQFRKVLSDIEQMEDTLFATIRKAAVDATGGLPASWAQALQGFRPEGSATGEAALSAVERLTSQSRDAVREGRALSQSAAQALLDHYAALASGVLIGMSGAMSGAPAAASERPRSKR